MFRLDSLAYRCIWRLKRILRFANCGPTPIRWSEKPSREFVPPPNFERTLNEKSRANFQLFLEELKILTRVESCLPEELSEKDWQKLVQLPSTKERYDHLRFLRQRNNRRTKEFAVECERRREREKCKQQWELANKAENEEQQEERQRLFFFRTFHIVRMERDLYSNKCVQAFQMIDDFPRVAIDCRWLHLHRDRALNLTARQLNFLLTNNRQRQQPWPLFLTNFDEQQPRVRDVVKSKLKLLESDQQFTAHVTNKSYTELFPELKEQGRIVYLSPHSKERLESIEPGTCYVIGAIVDRVQEPGIPLKASLDTAEAEGLPCRRLPLDYRVLKGGNPLFTLDQVLLILQDAFETGNWQAALETHIPKRKLLPPAEKNQIQRARHTNIVERNKAVLHILEKQTDKLRRTLLSDEQSQQVPIVRPEPIQMQQLRAFHSTAGRNIASELPPATPPRKDEMENLKVETSPPYPPSADEAEERAALPPPPSPKSPLQKLKGWYDGKTDQMFLWLVKTLNQPHEKPAGLKRRNIYIEGLPEDDDGLVRRQPADTPTKAKLLEEAQKQHWREWYGNEQPDLGPIIAKNQPFITAAVFFDSFLAFLITRMKLKKDWDPEERKKYVDMIMVAALLVNIILFFKIFRDIRAVTKQTKVLTKLAMRK